MTTARPLKSAAVGMSSVVYGQNVETDTSDDEAHDSNAHTKQRAGIAGALDDPTISPNGTSNVAVPEDYPLVGPAAILILIRCSRC